MAKGLKERMEASLSAFQNDLSGLRAGRPSPALLDSVTVEAYGDRMPINQIGTVSVPDAKTLSVQVWDKTMVAAVEKAIANADLGLNPVSDDTLVRVPVPPLSEERRREIVKSASQYAERSKVAIRNIRRDGMDEVKKQEKDGEISEDDSRKAGADIQKLTDDFVAKIDELLAKKEKDIMEV